MFAKFRLAQSFVYVTFAKRPESTKDFNAFLTEWFSCFQLNTGPLVFVFDARLISWNISDASYLVCLNNFLHDLRQSRETYPNMYKHIRRYYVITDCTYTCWLIRMLCAWQAPIVPVYLVSSPIRARDVEALMSLGIPINDLTAPDVICLPEQNA